MDKIEKNNFTYQLRNIAYFYLEQINEEIRLEVNVEITK
jgi:hypothetical protein